MRRVFGSVRFRVTAVATVVVALLLVGASLLVLRLVEDDLIEAAEEAITETVENISPDLGALRVPEDSLMPIEGPEGLLYVGFFEEDDTVIGELIDPDEGEAVGELIIDPDTGEILEAFGIEDEVPEELEELVVNVVRLEDDRIFFAAQSLEDVRDTVDSLRRSLLFVIPALLVLLAGLVWVLVGRALRPVSAITEQAHRITASTLHERVPVPGSADEVGALATVVNEMLDRIEAGVARQQQFVSDASHELRTPLASIRAAAELAATGKGDPQARAADVLAEADRMDRLVEDLLQLARLDEAGPGAMGPIDLAEVVGDVLERTDAEQQLIVRNLKSVPVTGHRGSLERLVANLLENAVRHAASRVTVTTKVEDGSAVLAVADDGPGIPPEDRERIFDRFVRLSESRTEAGFGLGLAIVKTIATRHGGRVWVADPGPDGGALVIVELPAES